MFESCFVSFVFYAGLILECSQENFLKTIYLDPSVLANYQHFIPLSINDPTISNIIAFDELNT